MATTPTTAEVEALLVEAEEGDQDDEFVRGIADTARWVLGYGQRPEAAE